MVFLTLLVVESFSFQIHFISPIFHGTSFYGVNVLFDVPDAALKHPSKDVLTFQKHVWLRNRYVWCSLVFVLVAAIITALVVALSEAESNRVPPSKAQLCYL
jgi:magnesium-transporting ATPase (P-type)